MRTHLSFLRLLILGTLPRRTRTLLFSSRDDNGVFSRKLPLALDSSLVFFAVFSPFDQDQSSILGFPPKARPHSLAFSFLWTCFVPLQITSTDALFPFRSFPYLNEIILFRKKLRLGGIHRKL